MKMRGAALTLLEVFLIHMCNDGSMTILLGWKNQFKPGF